MDCNSTGDGNITLNNASNVETYNEEILMIVGVAIFIENALSVFILTRCQKLVYQVRFLSLNLSLADCLVGLMCIIPYQVFDLLFSCKVKKYFNSAGIVTSLVTATLINFDRCLSMRYAIEYYKIVTKKRLCSTCLLIWVLAMVVSYAALFNPNSHTGLNCNYRVEVSFNIVRYCATTLLKIIIILNIPLYIYLIYNLKVKTLSLPKSTERGIEVTKLNSVNERTMKKLTLITGFLLTCYTPAFIFGDLDLFIHSKTIDQLKAVAEILIIANSFINPLLYIWRFYEARYQMRRLVYCWNRKKLQEFKRARQQYFATFDIDSVIKPNQIYFVKMNSFSESSV